MNNVAGSAAQHNRLFRTLGFILAALAIVSIALAIANTAYTYINYNSSINNGCASGWILNDCPVTFVYISSGIWGSLPVFITGIIALRIAQAPRMKSLLRILVMVSIIFTLAVIAISAIEIIAGDHGVWYTLATTAIQGTVIKFILPLAVAILAGLELIALILLLFYILRSNQPARRTGTHPADHALGMDSAPIGLPGDGYYDEQGNETNGDGWEDDWDWGYDDYDDYGDGGDYLDYEDEWEEPYYPPPPPPPSGGGQGGGVAASSSAAAGGGGGASNNNNNNIVVPPVIFPPQPQPPQNPVFFSTGGGAPPPQPVFLPKQRNHHHHHQPARPMLRPLPPTRYYPNRRMGNVSGGPSYLGGMGAPVIGKPWGRY